MAGAEVTVSSGAHRAVKEEEEESNGSNLKTQVILHLQPILHGVNDDIADTGTTVLAIETHHDDSQADGEEIEYGYPITCGDSRAVLLFKKFVCPGINVRCVKFNDQLISPKQFVHLAGKATLKDWKRAIRLGGVMLRKMMDSGQIDFYQHDTVCSNTCRSTKFDVLINSTKLPPGTSVQPSLSSLAFDPPGGQVPPLTEILHDAAEIEETLGDRFSSTAERSPRPAPPDNPATANGHASKRKRADTPDGVLSLWKGVADSGLMGEVLSSLQTELLATLKGVAVRSEKANLQETDAALLNSLCEMFGLLDSVKQALDLRCSHNSAHVLDEILVEQWKPGCDKSTSLNHLRPHRLNPLNSQTQNFLSPVKTSTVIQPLSVTGLSSASYAQFFAHFSASVGQHGHSRAGRMQREQPRELSETGGREKDQEVEEQDTSGSHKESGQRNGKSQEDHLISLGKEETDNLHEVKKVNIGRKPLKKHESK